MLSKWGQKYHFYYMSGNKNDRRKFRGLTSDNMDS